MACTLNTNTTYYARVRHKDGSGNISPWSDLVSFTTKAAPATTTTTTAAPGTTTTTTTTAAPTTTTTTTLAPGALEFGWADGTNPTTIPATTSPTANTGWFTGGFAGLFLYSSVGNFWEGNTRSTSLSADGANAAKEQWLTIGPSKGEMSWSTIDRTSGGTTTTQTDSINWTDGGNTPSQADANYEMRIETVVIQNGISTDAGAGQTSSDTGWQTYDNITKGNVFGIGASVSAGLTQTLTEEAYCIVSIRETADTTNTHSVAVYYVCQISP